MGHGWISHLGTRASHGRAGAKLYGHDMARCRKKMTHRNSKRRVGQASSRGEQDRERREGEDSVRVEGGGRSNLNPSRSEVGGRARGLGGPRRGGVAWGRVRTTPSIHLMAPKGGEVLLDCRLPRANQKIGHGGGIILGPGRPFLPRAITTARGGTGHALAQRVWLELWWPAMRESEDETERAWRCEVR